MEDKRIVSVITFSMLIESIITYAKNIFINSEIHWEMIISMIIGIIISLAYDLDLTSYFASSPKRPIIGYILTGVLISRGSNYLYDILGQIINLK